MSQKPEPDFTIDEAAEEMARLALEIWESAREPEDKGDEGLTTSEYAQYWGISKPGARHRVARLKQKGLLIEGRAYRETVDGRWERRPVYRPKREDEE